MLPLQSGLSYFKRIQNEAELAFEMLEQFGAQISNFGARSVKAKRAPKLEIQDLDFKYPGKSGKVLSGLTFSIPSGAYCAFVGKSGAGKSTLVDLILGLYEPDTGMVMIGKQAPRDYMRSNPSSVGYVPQSTALISGTFLENITLQPGMQEIHQEHLKSALRIANLDTLIGDLPQGLNTKLGQDGINLSGGQAQRVGLARAIYKNPRLLVLDEATSALDEESENSIRLALNNLKGKVTIIVIAHRPSTLRSADMVINIESTKATAFSSYDAYKAK
jgi:ABC-type multidrug transport system fused ATPase/permease subunit